MIEEDGAIRCVMHPQASAIDNDGPPREGTPVTYNRMEAKPIAGEHCRFCGETSILASATPPPCAGWPQGR